MQTDQKLTFDESTIPALFGQEDAAFEDLKRLRQYYFKSTTYDQLTADQPLRILVAHKGIGKSALFYVAMAEDLEANRLALVLTPWEIKGLGPETTDKYELIRAWRDGITEIVARKALTTLGIVRQDHLGSAEGPHGTILDLVDRGLQGRPASASSEAGTGDLIDGFRETRQINVYLDDLDSLLEGQSSGAMRVSTLINAVRSLTRDNPTVRFRISLRTNAYYAVRTSDESTDKIEGSVIWLSWTNHDIFALLAKRIETYFGRDLSLSEASSRKPWQLAPYLSPVFQNRFQAGGHWHNAPMYRVLMSLIRKRPRDLILLCTLAGRAAYQSRSQLINTPALESVFPDYSHNRIMDTITEYKTELPNVEALLLNMRPTTKARAAKRGHVYSYGDLLQKIRNIQSNQAAFIFRGARRPASDKELAAFMYKIDFLTARKDNPNGLITRKYFEEQRYLQSEFVDFGFEWEVHPAYRWALQPQSLADVYRSIELSEDDDD